MGSHVIRKELVTGAALFYECSGIAAAPVRTRSTSVKADDSMASAFVQKVEFSHLTEQVGKTASVGLGGSDFVGASLDRRSVT